MPAATLTTPVPSEFPPRKRFTRGEVDQMTNAGLLEGQRLELIDGDLIDKMGQNPPHAFTLRAIQQLLLKFFGGNLIQIQSPVEVRASDQEWSLPEPDLAILAEAKADYRNRFPRGDELLLLIEAAYTSLRHHTWKKRDLYARAGVPEYWVVDLAGRKLMIHRHLIEGEYRELTTLADSEMVAVELHSEARFGVAEMLP